jgi:hypothetical protein
LIADFQAGDPHMDFAIRAVSREAHLATHGDSRQI